MARANAQTPDHGDRARAKAEFILGRRAFEAKDYAEALRHFRKAFKLHRHDAVLFNIAVCLERMGRDREAAAEYSAAARSEELDSTTRARAARRAARARKKLGVLAVSGKPHGADVLVDGEQLCNLPCSVTLDPGRHHLLVQQGRLSDRRDVLIAQQEVQRVTVALRASPAPAPQSSSSVPTFAQASRKHPPAPQPRASLSPGWLTWTGAGVMVLGGAGITFFGLKAESYHDRWVNTGDQAARDDGVRARDLANASIGVAVVGAVAVGLDLLVLGPRRARRTESNRSAARGIGFAF